MKSIGRTIGKFLFKVRSYTPLPFILLIIIFSRPTNLSLIIGFIVFLAGSLLRFISVAYAGPATRSRDKGPDKLTVSGPFSIQRNPIYTGNIIIYSGIAVISNIFFPYFLFLILLFFFIQYHFIVLFEEDFLEKKFGNDYLDYKGKVKRWMPGFPQKLMDKDSSPDFVLALKSEKRTFQSYFLVVAFLLVIWYVK